MKIDKEEGKDKKARFTSRIAPFLKSDFNLSISVTSDFKNGAIRLVNLAFLSFPSSLSIFNIVSYNSFVIDIDFPVILLSTAPIVIESNNVVLTFLNKSITFLAPKGGFIGFDPRISNFFMIQRNFNNKVFFGRIAYSTWIVPSFRVLN